MEVIQVCKYSACIMACIFCLLLGYMIAEGEYQEEIYMQKKIVSEQQCLIKKLVNTNNP